MYPHSHFITALTLSEIAVNQGVLNHQQAVLTAILAVLVDIDHYLYFAKKKNDLNLVHAWNYCTKVHDDSARTIFHRWPGILTMALICAILYFYAITAFWIVFVAYFSHRFLDFIPIENSSRKLSLQIGSLYMKIAKEEIWFDLAIIIILIYALYNSINFQF